MNMFQYFLRLDVLLHDNDLEARRSSIEDNKLKRPFYPQLVNVFGFML